MRVLFLNPPSFQGFDGGAGSRYQAKREIRSFWYPTWLAQAAALVPESRVVDAPADDLDINDVLKIARDYDIVVIYTSTPSFAADARTAVRIKEQNKDTLIGFVGPHVSVLPEESLNAASAADFVVRKEFELPVKALSEGSPMAEIRGLSWRDGAEIRRNLDSEMLTDLDALPFVIDVYKRDLTIENYYVGYLMHPYVSIYTGRGCPSRCTYCLWPQTLSGRTYRVRSPESVCRELMMARDYFPQAKELFIDDDTFTADRKRAEEIGRRLAGSGIVWSTSSRVSVPFETLKTLKESGLRLLMVGYESGSDEILRNARKGINTAMARRFTRDCRSLGIQLHGTFMLGLPGETKETIEQTIRYACELNPDTIQVSIAAPYPGTELYRQAQENGWLTQGDLVSEDGTQSCLLHYEGLEAKEIVSSVDRFYKRFYFRPKVMARIGRKMLVDGDERRRRLREGREFFSFLKRDKRRTDRPGSMLSQVLKDGGPGFAQFAITNACNAGCGFCNFRRGSEDVGEPIFAPVDKSCAALDILADVGVSYVVFTGGEPTLHPGLPEMLSHAKRLQMKNLVCTNGMLLTPDRVSRYIGAGLDSMIISIDAPSAETHERNRGLSGVCERIAQANTILKEAGVGITASVTLSRLLGGLSELPEFLRSLGFEQVTFSYPLTTLPSSFLGYSGSNLVDYSPDELFALFDDVKKLKKRFRVLNPTASLEEMQRFVKGEPQRYPCLAGLKYFHLDWNFDLYRCHAWPKPMCSVFEFDRSLLIRDGCTACMIDCYRDSSVLHHTGIAIFDAWTNLKTGRLDRAARHLLNRRTWGSVKSVVEGILGFQGSKVLRL